MNGNMKSSARNNNHTAIDERQSHGVGHGGKQQAYDFGSSGNKKNFALTTALKNITQGEHSLHSMGSGYYKN